MNWSHVRLILGREVRDQLRDRRTLFMIAVLPLLLYPLLGMSMFQIGQFVREQPTRVLLLGAEALPAEPKLVEDRSFAVALFAEPDQQRLVELHLADSEPGPTGKAWTLDDARRAVETGHFEAVVHVPSDFSRLLGDFQRQLKTGAETKAGGADTRQAEPQVPSPEILFNTAKEKSQLAFMRVSQLLERWREQIGRQNLIDSRLSPEVARPFAVSECDVAGQQQRESAVWSKVMPFLLLIWALTGAFYPAVDLCAGEKERGTLETLLSSPAQRIDIVGGKLLTVMLFSFSTAVLNILSMGLTGSIVMRQFPELGAPPPLAPLWLLVALVPVSALFGALCLALAALARSSKEGQYYLMPLVLVTLPLVVLPMAPGVELNLGNSLVPVTGIMLLLRTLLEGEYLRALQYVGPVACVTLACCLAAVRWAVDQFNSESVLFRESERFDMGLWFKHLLRDREDTPSASEAVVCGLLILLVRFFMSFALPQPGSFGDLIVLTLVTQLVVIGTPVMLMTIMLTRSPRATLLLRLPRWDVVPMAALLAVLMHPSAQLLSRFVQFLYPVNREVREALDGLMAGSAGHFWEMLLAMAIAPAVFEELAFRGFILSGFRRLGHQRQAIALSAFFFGISHALFQQSIVACLLGLVLGLVAVRSGSLLPCLTFHLIHNTLSLLAAQPGAFSWLGELVEAGEDGPTFGWPVIIVSGLLSALILVWFRRLPYPKTREEALEAARELADSKAEGGGRKAEDAAQAERDEQGDSDERRLTRAY